MKSSKEDEEFNHVMRLFDPLYGRPSFPTPEDYVAHVAATLEAGGDPYPPQTVAELTAVTAAIPEFARRWLPSRSDRLAMGLPDDFGKPAEPFDPTWQRRYAATLLSDPEGWGRGFAFCLNASERGDSNVATN